MPIKGVSFQWVGVALAAQKKKNLVVVGMYFYAATLNNEY